MERYKQKTVSVHLTFKVVLPVQWTVSIELEQADFFLRIFPENEMETTWDFESLCVFLWKCHSLAYFGPMDFKKSSCRY